MKIKILIPVYNDWQSVFKLLENINSEVSNLGYEFSGFGIIASLLRLISSASQ